MLLGILSNGVAKIIKIIKIITFGTWFFLTPFILQQLGISEWALWEPDTVALSDVMAALFKPLRRLNAGLMPTTSTPQRCRNQSLR